MAVRETASAPLPFGSVMSVTRALQARRGQQQRRADHVEKLVGLAEAGLDRNAGEDAMVGADDDDVPAGGDAP